MGYSAKLIEREPIAPARIKVANLKNIFRYKDNIHLTFLLRVFLTIIAVLIGRLNFDDE